MRYRAGVSAAPRLEEAPVERTSPMKWTASNSLLALVALNTLLALAALAVALTAAATPSEAQDPLPAYYYGGGLRWGDVVTAWIGDAECGAATVDDSGGWQLRVHAGDCGGAAEDGATIRFTVTPSPNVGPRWTAQQTAPWSAGSVPDDVANGITLTGSPGALGWRCRDANTGQWFWLECGAEFERRADARYAAADHSHGAAAAPEPTPGDAQDPSASVAPARLVTYYYGGGLDEGDRVTAWIDGFTGGLEGYCGASTAGADGGWLINAGDCYTAAAPGATVNFAVNGVVAEQSVPWSAADLRGITLTLPAIVTEYAVQVGDALWSIARQLAGPGADYEDFAHRIADLNGLGPDSTLRIGQVLRIPPP